MIQLFLKTLGHSRITKNWYVFNEQRAATYNSKKGCCMNEKVMYCYGPPHMAVQKQDDQHEHTFSNYVRIRDAVQKTCLRWWTIGKSSERGSGISVLPARHDDDDDDEWKKLWKSLLGEKHLLGKPVHFSVKNTASIVDTRGFIQQSFQHLYRTANSIETRQHEFSDISNHTFRRKEYSTVVLEHQVKTYSKI